MTTTRADRAAPRRAPASERDEYPGLGAGSRQLPGGGRGAPPRVAVGRRHSATHLATVTLPTRRRTGFPVSATLPDGTGPLSPSISEPVSPTTRASASSPLLESSSLWPTLIEPLLLPTPLVMPHELPLSARTPVRPSRLPEPEPQHLPSAPRWHPVDPRAVSARVRRLRDEDEPCVRPSRHPLARRTALAAVTVLTVLGLVVGVWHVTRRVATVREDAGSAMPTVASMTPQTSAAAGIDSSGIPAVLRANPVYSQPVVGSCDRVAAPATAQASEAAMTAYVACMNTVWSQIVGATSFSFVPASVKFFGDAVSNPCTTIQPGDRIAAMYCPLDATIYVSALGLSQSIGARFYASELVTHEYAHHVQSLTQILTAAHEQGWPDDEYNRRIQLQAHCLSFALLTHVAGFDTDVPTFRAGWAASPGSRTYGSRASLQLWGERGLAATSVGACQTFTSPSAEVA